LTIYDYPIYTAWSYISMHSLTPEYLAALRFDGTQAATLRTLGEHPNIRGLNK